MEYPGCGAGRRKQREDVVGCLRRLTVGKSSSEGLSIPSYGEITVIPHRAVQRTNPGSCMELDTQQATNSTHQHCKSGLLVKHLLTAPSQLSVSVF